MSPFDFGIPQGDLPCSALARALGEPLYGTAPVSRAWLLLEQPGPWGARALFESEMDLEMAGDLDRRSTKLGFRILLIRRRPGRYQPHERTCYLARSDRSGVWMEKIGFSDPSELLELDLRVFAGASSPGLGSPVEQPVYVVCTNGRRDPCCAEHGRRLGAALSELPAGLWESSHLGGHRFAANLACFPEAIFYGRVGPDAGAAVVRAHELGELSLDHYRGRSCDDEVVQAADYLVRRETGLLSIAELVPEELHDPGDGSTVEAVFRHPGGQYLARVEVRLGQARPTSCRSDKVEHLKEYRLTSLASR